MRNIVQVGGQTCTLTSADRTWDACRLTLPAGGVHNVTACLTAPLSGRYCDSLTTVGLAAVLDTKAADDEDYDDYSFDYSSGDSSMFYSSVSTEDLQAGLGEGIVPGVRMDQEEFARGTAAATMSLDVPYENATLFVVSKDAFTVASVTVHDLGPPGAHIQLAK